jgi:trehalose 6-phosphate synthase/phosphatase
MDPNRRTKRKPLAALSDRPAAPWPRSPSARQQAPIHRAADAVREARSLCLLLDYDGTLVPLAPTPEQAAPDGPLRGLLTRLAQRPSTSVHIVTGRTRDSIEAFLGELPIALHAEYGAWQRSGPGRPWESWLRVDDSWRGVVHPVFSRYVDQTPRSRIEEKQVAITWHFRQVDWQVAEQQAQRLTAELAGLRAQHRFELIVGNKVVEARAPGVTKAIVVHRIRSAGAQQLRLLAMGDDVSDEDMFGALSDRDIAVRVGEGPSCAPYRVEDAGAARSFLASLVE